MNEQPKDGTASGSAAPVARPALNIFFQTPLTGGGRHCLNSSLQTMETCLLALAFRRHAHAVVLGISAIESLLREYLQASWDPTIPLHELLDAVHRKHAALKDVCEKTELEFAISARNAFVHAGYSPKDNRQSIEMLVGSILPYYKSALRELFGFDMHENMDELYARHLKIAHQAYHQARKLQIEDPGFCISALAHFMRWEEMMCTLPEGSASLLFGGADEGYQRMARTRDVLEKRMANPWFLLCPVCRACEAFVIDLDGEKLDRGMVTGTQASCANCEYTILKPWGFMIDLLCGDQLADKKDEVLSTFSY